MLGLITWLVNHTPHRRCARSRDIVRDAGKVARKKMPLKGQNYIMFRKFQVVPDQLKIRPNIARLIKLLGPNSYSMRREPGPIKQFPRILLSIGCNV